MGYDLMNRVKRGVLATALLLIGAAPAAAQGREPYPGYDAYVTAALRTWKVPGLAIAIVRNDSVIYAKGYGVRELGKSNPVTARTIFAIGSASKAFTAAAVAMLVDDGKLRWDDAATRYLPNLQLYDPYATRELSIRDLLSHRSGLARGDLVWYGTEFDRDEILRRVRFLQPSWSFRAQFGYQNIMYLAAGQVVGRAANTTWDDVVKRRIFAPLGMESSVTSTRPLASMSDVATPHAEIDDTVRVVPWRNIDNIAPAGSINSNVLEMSQWVRLQLAKGKFRGTQLISSAQIEEMHAPHTIVRRDPIWKVLFPETNFFEYGLGWFLQDYRGKKVVQHGGNIDGMSALVTMIPSDNFGMVILTNMNGSALPSVLMYRTFDLHLKAQPRDWSTEMRKSFEALQAQGKETQKKLEAERVTGTKPSLALRDYAGAYVDSMYGETKVSEQGGKLLITRSPAFEGELEHWHFDTFRSKWRHNLLGKTFVSFRLGPTGKAEELAIDMGGAPVTFKRRPEMADTTPGVRIADADLRKYLGTFQSTAPPASVTVEKVGDDLKLTVPGQPAYTLVPVTTTRFRLTGQNVPTGFFLDYTLEGGKVRSVTLVQPSPRPSLTLTPAG
jgi:CubicO group peptidase (beta-lactamase class C family)